MLNAKLDEKQEIIRTLQRELANKISESDAEIEIKKREIAALEEQVEAGHVAKAKLSQSLSQDMTRLEKKLAAQV
jgi:vacuolar-type H+-ATPase subunit I/STV1